MSPPWCRKLRISVGLAMALLAAVAIPLGLVVNRARSQARAVAAIREAGGYVTYDWEFPPDGPRIPPPEPSWYHRCFGLDYFQSPYLVELIGPEKGDEVMVHVGKLASLRGLDISQTRITDVGLARLARLPRLLRVDLFDNRETTGAGLAALRDHRDLVSLNLIHDGLRDDDLAPIATLIHLEILSLYCKEIGDAGMHHLRGLSGLKSLDLGSTRVTAAGLDELRGLANLEKVNLPDTVDGIGGLRNCSRLRELKLANPALDDRGLEGIEGLTALEWLDLYPGYGKVTTTRITDAGLSRLKGLVRLERLSVPGSQVTDAGLSALANLNRLTWLDLSRTRITDAGMVHILGLPALESLHLRDTAITDAILERLAAVTSLRQVMLMGTRATKEGGTRLEAAVPHLGVRWSS